MLRRALSDSREMAHVLPDALSPHLGTLDKTPTRCDLDAGFALVGELLANAFRKPSTIDELLRRFVDALAHDFVLHPPDGIDSARGFLGDAEGMLPRRP